MHARTRTRTQARSCCFSTATMIRERASLLRYTYTACLVCHVTELFVSRYVVMLKHGRKNQFQLNNIKRSFGYVTLITVQNNPHRFVCIILRVKKRMCFLFHYLIISDYAIGVFHDSLQQFSLLRILPVEDVLHVSLQDGVRSGDFIIMYWVKHTI
jgi:hypothetical protein